MAEPRRHFRSPSALAYPASSAISKEGKFPISNWTHLFFPDSFLIRLYALLPLSLCLFVHDRVPGDARCFPWAVLTLNPLAILPNFSSFWFF